MMHLKEFSELKAVEKLSALAASPYDLRKTAAFSAPRVNQFTASAGDFDFLYAMQRLDERVVETLQELADETGLIDKFLAMKKGEKLNRIEGYESENRRVLHTACRDIFSSSPLNLEATSQAQQQLARLRRFLEDIEQGKIVNHRGETFTTVIQIGIGGSDLGPRALCHALQRYRVPGRSAGFISNVDPDDTARVLAGVDLSRTIFNVVSKSGTTLETLTNQKLVRTFLEQAGLEPRRHMTAVTGAGSPMDDPEKYLAAFHMYDYIGGRYSVTSMVGGVVLGFALGYDTFVDILHGAHTIDIAAEERNIRKNVVLLMAMIGIWNRNFLGHDTLAILPYSQALERFPAHLQQCDMESNGKSVSRNGNKVSWQTGPIVWGEPGTNGQHAFYQLLHQGTTTVPIDFIGFRQSQYGHDIQEHGTSSQEKLVVNMLAQALALAQGKEDENPNRRFPGNRPNSILIADRLTPQTMGQLLALYENKIVLQGFCWNINSFDQEGVQLGKVLADRMLEDVAAGHEKNLDNRDRDTIEYMLLRIAGVV
ncbi:MAG: glucose-6-phosphate isomerase [Desulfobulbaceae bacterium]|nr:glucose-6-phosphate isomerase [Desulfobulbaceae bacterium]